MAVTIDGTSGINTPGVVNTAAETIATTLAVTGVTTFAAGTAALPAITTTGDTNTGIFFPAADTIGFSEGGAEAMRINSSGNVGIGTSSPNTKLHITGNLTIENSTNAPFIDFTESGDNTDIKARIQMDQDSGTAGSLLFYTEGGGTLAERARIDSSGSLLVGATSSSVGGVTLAQLLDARTRNSGFGLGVVGNSSNTQIQRFYFDTTAVGSINVSGSATTYSTSSDYRLKNTIAPMTGALAKVALLKPVTYKWNVDGSDGQGFIAHELADVVPQCVTGEKDAVNAEGNSEYQGIDTSFLVATLTAAIQEQQALITALTTRITALEAA